MSVTHTDLTRGPIFSQLIKLSIPIMATSFMQMAYNLTDMIWIGRVGSGAVAAVGTAGFLVWFGNSLLFSTKIGAEVNVSQSLGHRDLEAAAGYGRSSFRLAFLLSAVYGLFLVAGAKALIGFFALGVDNGYDVTAAGIQYLRIIGAGSVFMFANPTMTGIYNGLGNSRLPFQVNAVGLVINMVMDPVLIFGLGPFPAMGVRGAAIATILSQMTVFLLFLSSFSKNKVIALNELFKRARGRRMANVLKIGLPPALQNMLFAFFAMVIAKILSTWGPVPIAVQKVGSQIEALSWLTAGGIATSLGAFVGQNYGAKDLHRIKQGYKTAMGIMGVVGLAATGLLVFAGEPIFRVFINEPHVIPEGVLYLKILGYSQLFMAIEITTAGAFNGMGKTLPPALTSVIFTGLRIPASLLLTGTSLGVAGVWWSVSGSSIIKGTLLVLLFLPYISHFRFKKKGA